MQQFLGRGVQPGVGLHAGRSAVLGPGAGWARRHRTLVRSSPEPPPPPGEVPDSQIEELRNKFFAPQPQSGRPGPSSGTETPRPVPGSDAGPSGASGAALDSVNPYALGRQARRAFDEVWSQLSNLASPTKSFIIDDTMEPSRDADFSAAQAAYTTVLVVGATGRVGRILLRKLLLRGYTVKALVRPRRVAARDEYASLPAAVEIVEGDLGDPAACQEAVRGVNKVIFCAGARSTLTADLNRVDDRGVMNIVKAMQDEFARAAHRERLAALAGEDTPAARRARRRMFSPRSKKEIADFSQMYHQLRWDIRWVGTPEERAAAAEGGAEEPAGTARPAMQRWMAASTAVAEINNEDHLVFEGKLFQRGAYAEVGASLHSRLPGGEHRTAGTEAITLRVRGDGNQYSCVLGTASGHTYVARFPTRAGFLNVRLPYASFRPEQQGAPPLAPERINSIAIRYEVRRQLAAAGPPSSFARVAVRGAGSGDEGKFSLEIDWIKAIPGGEEPDCILVSSSRGAFAPLLQDGDAMRVVGAKRRGEDNLRLSGLGYTIIRAGQLVDEPGGYRALVFDQGDRIEQPISAADVADICLRALHEPNARNKTFDVCYELPADSGTSLYELVTSVPDKSGSYLSQATATLSKNT